MIPGKKWKNPRYELTSYDWRKKILQLDQRWPVFLRCFVKHGCCKSLGVPGHWNWWGNHGLLKIRLFHSRVCKSRSYRAETVHSWGPSRESSWWVPPCRCHQWDQFLSITTWGPKGVRCYQWGVSTCSWDQKHHFEWHSSGIQLGIWRFSKNGGPSNHPQFYSFCCWNPRFWGPPILRTLHFVLEHIHFGTGSRAWPLSKGQCVPCFWSQRKWGPWSHCDFQVTLFHASSCCHDVMWWYPISHGGTPIAGWCIDGLFHGKSSENRWTSSIFI